MCLKNLALYRIPRLPSLVIMNVWWWPWYELLLTLWCQRAIANGAASWTQTCNVLCPWALFRETAVMFFFLNCACSQQNHIFQLLLSALARGYIQIMTCMSLRQHLQMQALCEGTWWNLSSLYTWLCLTQRRKQRATASQESGANERERNRVRKKKKQGESVAVTGKAKC